MGRLSPPEIERPPPQTHYVPVGQRRAELRGSDPWRVPRGPTARSGATRGDRSRRARAKRNSYRLAKPRGFPLIPHGGLYLTHTLLHQLRRRWHGATPMHRLGRGTSGVLLLARTPAARRGVAAAWREGRVEKTYRALVQGVPGRERFSIDHPIGPVAHTTLGRVHAASDSGKPSLPDAPTRSASTWPPRAIPWWVTRSTPRAASPGRGRTRPDHPPE
jgi:hypothetical protein